MSTTIQEPPWLLAKVDQRLALIRPGLELAELMGDTTVVMTTLTEPPPNATPEQAKRWDRTCDCCGEYCPTTLWTGHVQRVEFGSQVIIVFGVCPTCKERHPDG